MITLDDLCFGCPAPMQRSKLAPAEADPQEYVLHIPVWLRSDIVDGWPTIWPRLVCSLYVTYEMVDDLTKNGFYRELPEFLRTNVAIDLDDPEVQRALSVDNVSNGE